MRKHKKMKCDICNSIINPNDLYGGCELDWLKIKGCLTTSYIQKHTLCLDCLYSLKQFIKTQKKVIKQIIKGRMNNEKAKT
jgi:hypothetical protein